ncbi:MAG TPA: adenylate/guanylate cyclase domain-containing protein [Solirubrobacteraceae bacterium]|jgi:adenylate cyclase|nr:adenylate/guanylate cyclase domain-containing protein [Solirubrobacteraceae bacterium]
MSLGLHLGQGRARRRRAVLLLVVGVGLTGLALVAYATSALDGQELGTIAARFAIRGSRKPPKDVVLVEIDSATFAHLPEYQWPYPRQLHGAVIDHIVADHPKAIGYDIQFTETPPDPRQNLDLAQSIYDATGAGVPIVLDTTDTTANGSTGILGGDKVLHAIGAQPSSALFPSEPDDTIRRVSYAMGGLRTFAVVLAAAADRAAVKPSSFGGRPAWIDYVGPAGTIPSVSFYRVLHGQVPASFFRGKVVVVGVSDTAEQDLHDTPVGPLMPGAEVQANAVQTVREGLPLRSAPGWLDVGLILLLGLAAPAASLLLSPLRAVSLAVPMGGAFVVAAQLAFDDGVIVTFVYPLAALLLAAAGSLGVHYTIAAFERERVRDLFSRFVPENVVGEVLAQAGANLRLGGVHRISTVMFTDLRGFTTFAEALSPDRVIAVLNEYLSSMSDAILDHGGTLVAYMGDGIMAVFGAPIAHDDHADQALSTAREMLEERLPRFNAWLREEGLGDGFRMGIGLNSGAVMSGNVGSERRVEYTAIGDTTNTASRIEGMTKGTPHQLLFTESTRELLREPPADMVFVDEFEVRGRQAQVKLWSLAVAASGESGVAAAGLEQTKPTEPVGGEASTRAGTDRPAPPGRS